jgi:aldehyde:ferredoxin oxidoreductase
MRILVIDLEAKDYSYVEDESLRSQYIGGSALNTYLLYKNTDRNIDPYDARNSLFFGSGAFVGTTIPTASRCEATALSPSGYFGTSNAGGKTGFAMKLCGIDSIWIKGKSRDPVYAVVDEKGVAFKDASHLWGKDSFETVRILKEEEGTGAEVVSIGQAGERGVRFASIQADYHHSFGRTGLGAIMGSKNLKAICFVGKGDIKVRDKKLLRETAKKMRERILSSDTFGYTRRYGSMVVSDVYNKMGILPGRNYTKGSFDNWEETRGRRFFEEKYKVRDLACVACPIGCLHWSKVKDGEYAGYETCGLEVTFTFEFGAKLDIAAIPEIFQCVELCNRLGMDVISTSSVIAYTIELFEKGFLNEDDIGFRPAFGDFRNIYRLIGLIGRAEGIGELLGQGIRRMSQKFRGAEAFACEVKGVELPVRDPRGRFDTWMLGVLINTRGGDHLRIRTPVDDLKDIERTYKYEPLGLKPTELKLLDMPQAVKDSTLGVPPTRVDIPAMAKYSEEYMVLLNSFGLCIRPPVMRTIGPSILSEAFRAVYGCETDENELLTIAERAVNMAHLFNLERGLTLQEYRYPERFYKESVDYLKGRRLPLDNNEVEDALKRYFALRGWDEKAHVRKETMKRLGI